MCRAIQRSFNIHLSQPSLSQPNPQEALKSAVAALKTKAASPARARGKGRSGRDSPGAPHSLSGQDRYEEFTRLAETRLALNT